MAIHELIEAVCGSRLAAVWFEANLPHARNVTARSAELARSSLDSSQNDLQLHAPGHLPDSPAAQGPQNDGSSMMEAIHAVPYDSSVRDEAAQEAGGNSEPDGSRDSGAR